MYNEIKENKKRKYIFKKLLDNYLDLIEVSYFLSKDTSF